MASTNFKLFDENKTNMMSDTEYNINTQRLNGVQAGIASSQLQNKTLHQTSLVAYSLAQIMMQNGYDANDSAAVSAFVGNMSNSLLQKVLDKATSAEAQNGVNNTKWMTPSLTKAAIDILAAKSSNILSNETKTLYGLESSSVPDDILNKLSKSIISNGTQITDVLGNLISIPVDQVEDSVKITVGSYKGTGVDNRVITLGTRSKAVLVCTEYGIMWTASEVFGGLALDGFPSKARTDMGVVYDLITITDTGFKLRQPGNSYIQGNRSGTVYHYIAFC